MFRIITRHAKTNRDFEKTLLDLHHHIARLAWLIQEYLFLVKKVTRTNTENSAEVGLFVTSLIHLVLFIQIQSNS